MTYRNATLEGKTLDLDEDQFHNCTIIKCTLQYGGGGVVLNDCKMHGNSWKFVNAALRTIDILHYVFLTGGQEVIEHVIRRIKEGEPMPPGIN
jgi:hypothetical protein